MSCFYPANPDNECALDLVTEINKQSVSSISYKASHDNTSTQITVLTWQTINQEGLAAVKVKLNAILILYVIQMVVGEEEYLSPY